MAEDWILDVLADLRRFAQLNGLPGLARQVEETALVAARELAQAGRGAGPGRTDPAVKPARRS